MPLSPYFYYWRVVWFDSTNTECVAVITDRAEANKLAAEVDGYVEGHRVYMENKKWLTKEAGASN
jgi:hypothetical protein